MTGQGVAQQPGKQKKKALHLADVFMQTSRNFECQYHKECQEVLLSKNMRDAVQYWMPSYSADSSPLDGISGSLLRVHAQLAGQLQVALYYLGCHLFWPRAGDDLPIVPYVSSNSDMNAYLTTRVSPKASIRAVRVPEVTFHQQPRAVSGDM